MKNQKQEKLADIQFFSKVGEEIRKIREESIEAQAIARRIKKIAVMKQQTEKPKSAVPDNILKNIIIDFLRVRNLNYSYSVFMRECDLLSNDIILKPELAQFFQLQPYYTNLAFNPTVIELILEKNSHLERNKKEGKDFGMQIQLVKSDNTLNSVILNEIQLAAIRKQVEDREKKHYQNLLASMKKSMSVSLREQIKRQYELKMKEMKAEYERQVNILKQKNKQFLIGNPKINPKIEEYLNKIEELQSKNMNLILSLKQMQKQKISHNCFKVPKIIERQKELDILKRDLQKKKQQYEFALKTLHTSTQNIASKKQKATETPRQTDLFLAELKNKKNTKDYMIDEMHGRMLVMDKRIDALSKDNQSLREINRQLTSKITQVQQINAKIQQNLEQNAKIEQKAKIMGVKPQSKNISIGVSPQEFKEKQKENVIDEIEQNSSSSDSDFDQQINKKTKFKLKIHEMDIQMQAQKNKLKLFLDDFN